MTIVATQSVSLFFGEVVAEAIRTRGVEATDGAAHYLVGLLADFVHPDRRADEALQRPLTLLLDEAMHLGDAGERFRRLQTLGDGILYGCGFFGDHFEARGVDVKYVQSLGTRAYDAAGVMLRRSPEPRGPDLFGELAQKFGAFAEVLADVADATLAMSGQTSRGLVRVYERWLRTGSDRLANALTSRGVVPTRGGPKGVLQ